MPPLARIVATALCLAAATSAVHAQQRVTASGSSSAVTRPAPATPNPAGLRSMFPAGISSGSGAAVSTDPIAAANSPVPVGTNTIVGPTTIGGGGYRVPTELFPAAGTTTTSTAVMGAGPVAGPNQYGAGGAAGFSATDTARSFYFADGNHDGELTPAEARRLSIATMSFEQMDRNFDGVISRFEYEDSLR